MIKNETHIEIKKDFQIKKFCAYGFLKNLKFFEPYLILYLMSCNISLFEIGILIAIREIIVNIFEIPSGIIADYFGRKKEMYLCFGFYIVSFVFFFFSSSFAIAVFAMIFFGLGEAFRSGTHKAMIYTYLDEKNWVEHKAFVYGRTRSCSLIGSAISSVLAVVFILIVPADKFIFLFSIIPYMLDLLLIISYPNFLDVSEKKKKTSLKSMLKVLVESFKNSKKLRALLIEDGMISAAFSYIKDLIQPIMELIIVGSGVVFIASLSAENNLKIVLGVIYAIINLVGSVFSKKAYIIKNKCSTLTSLYVIHFAFAILCAILAVFSWQYIIVFVVYVVVYILQNVRKPLFVDEIDNHIEKSTRATVISGSSQIKSLFLMVGAPLLGLLADNFNLGVVMITIALLFFVTIPLLKFKNK